MKESMIPLGRFFFKWRNLLFPLIVLALFLSSPPAQEIFGSANTESLLDATGITIVALGVLIRLLVMGFFGVARNGANKTAYADELFTRGMFGISRNSLYLGNLTIYTGIFMLHGTWPVFVAGVAIFLFIYYAIIFSEESFLAGKFGDSFSAYVKSVPRLLPRLSNWAAATGGMSFSWKRAVFVEYNIIGQAVLMIALALWYESYTQTGAGRPPVPVAALLIAGAVFVATIRIIKTLRRRGGSNKLSK